MLTAGLTFFWTIPVAAISALTSLSSLESFFPVLTPFLSDPMVSDFISGTLPSGLLIATMSVLPYLLRFIALYIGKTSETEVTETSLLLTMVTHGPCWGLHRERERDMLRRFSHLPLCSLSQVTEWVVGRYYFFLIFNVFLVSAISSSMIASVSQLAADPSSITETLASSLPEKVGQAVPSSCGAATAFPLCVHCLASPPLDCASTLPFFATNSAVRCISCRPRSSFHTCC